MGLSSMNDKTVSRRAVVAGLPFLLAGCAGGYGAITGEPHAVPSVSIDPSSHAPRGRLWRAISTGYGRSEY